MNLIPRDAEIIIGLVARIGVDVAEVVKALKLELSEYNYSVFEVRVTEAIRWFSNRVQVVEAPVERRFASYIRACNTLRTDLGHDVLAELAILQINSLRQNAPTKAAASRTAYIVNQIKRPEEFELFRQVYGEHYIQISCHADHEVRVASLTSMIIDSHKENPKSSDWDIEARKLVHTDEWEEGEDHGQRVRQVFPLSDVILDAQSANKIQAGLERFLRAIFGDARVTPSKNEYGMEFANVAAQRSSDMSRQVGAAIFNERMEIQSVGCNEVSKAFGECYWEGDEPDGREFTLNRDSNDQRREAVLFDLVSRLANINALRADLLEPGKALEFIGSVRTSDLADSQLMDSLEYGRSVHAEMSAIVDAARGGRAINSSTLYCNTFPCHNCAKHIVASGIQKVIYNHPFPKSYVSELYPDSIVINPDHSQVLGPKEKVEFQQFLGIVGPMYARVFTKKRWKDKFGRRLDFTKSLASFIRRTPLPAYDEHRFRRILKLNSLYSMI